MSSERFKLHDLHQDDPDAVDTVRTLKLSLEDTLSQTMRGLRTPCSKTSGYNPYDTFPNVSSTGTFAQHRDLRELSEWIRLKRQVGRLKGEDGDDDKDPE